MPTNRSIITPDQISLNVLCWGEEHQTTPCFLLHGFTNDAHLWDQLALLLSQSRPVYALDFRGHGDSDWDPNVRYHHQQLACDIQTVLTALNLKKIHLLGYSLGARIGMLWAENHRETLASFTIVDTGPEVRAAGVNKVRRDAEAMPKEFASVNDYVALMQRIYFLAKPKLVATLAQHNLRKINDKTFIPKTDPAFTSSLWKPDSQNNNASDLSDPLVEALWLTLASITAPVLIIKGQLSAILAKRTAEKMLNTIPNAQLRLIANAGHAVIVDNPEEFNEAVIDFITKNTPS